MTATPHTLVTAEQLKILLAGTEPPLVVDASFDLADVAASRRAYDAGHVPV